MRFENCIRALAPGLTILAPLQTLGLQSAEDDFEYARTAGIPLTGLRHEVLSIEQNIWGASIRLDPVLDPWTEPGRDTYIMTTPPEEAPDRPAYIDVRFREGTPISLDGKDLSSLRVVETLNHLGGRHAIGRLEMIENRISGVKSRELYEAPGATLLYAAHTALEEISLDKASSRVREILSREYARLVYDGLWFTRLRESVDAFFDRLQSSVSGVVRLKLYRGGLQVVGRRAAESLYRPDILGKCGEEIFEVPPPPPEPAEAATLSDARRTPEDGRRTRRNRK
jgi:argininosuccinate synthase